MKRKGRDDAGISGVEIQGLFWLMTGRMKPWIIEMSLWEIGQIYTTSMDGIVTRLGHADKTEVIRCWCWCWHAPGTVFVADEKEGEG